MAPVVDWQQLPFENQTAWTICFIYVLSMFMFTWKLFRYCSANIFLNLYKNGFEMLRYKTKTMPNELSETLKNKLKKIGFEVRCLQ
jgi:hypothetical protein